jgi:hypothetical protein
MKSARPTVGVRENSLLQQERFFGIGQCCAAKLIDCDSIKDEHRPPYQRVLALSWVSISVGGDHVRK